MAKGKLFKVTLLCMHVFEMVVICCSALILILDVPIEHLSSVSVHVYKCINSISAAIPKRLYWLHLWWRNYSIKVIISLHFTHITIKICTCVQFAIELHFNTVWIAPSLFFSWLLSKRGKKSAKEGKACAPLGSLNF